MSLMSLGLIRLQEVGRRGLLRGWGFYTKGASTRPLRPTLGSKPLGFGAWGGRYGGDDPRTSESLARTGMNRIEWGGWATGARGEGGARARIPLEWTCRSRFRREDDVQLVLAVLSAFAIRFTISTPSLQSLIERDVSMLA